MHLDGWFWAQLYFGNILEWLLLKDNCKDIFINLIDIVRNLNVQKTLRRRQEGLLNALCTFNLRAVSTGNSNGYTNGLHF